MTKVSVSAVFTTQRQGMFNSLYVFLFEWRPDKRCTWNQGLTGYSVQAGPLPSIFEHGRTSGAGAAVTHAGGALDELLHTRRSMSDQPKRLLQSRCAHMSLAHPASRFSLSTAPSPLPTEPLPDPQVWWSHSGFGSYISSGATPRPAGCSMIGSDAYVRGRD